MEDFEKWLNEQKNSIAWALLGEESRLYQAWVCGAMNQARLTSRAVAPPSALMQPSNFLKHPYSSVLSNSKCETVARNIMVIMSKTGNEFRLLAWDEYKQARLSDGNFTEPEKGYFDRVVGFCVSEHSANAFCPTWSGGQHEHN